LEDLWNSTRKAGLSMTSIHHSNIKELVCVGKFVLIFAEFTSSPITSDPEIHDEGMEGL
jgi:hypothetical protein